jgi:hypothetical protein
VLGVTIGYLPPAHLFLPFTGGPPRILDTRVTGGKPADGEERVIALGVVGARCAVINLTVAETEGEGGFVDVFPSNVPYPASPESTGRQQVRTSLRGDHGDGSQRSNHASWRRRQYARRDRPYRWFV